MSGLILVDVSAAIARVTLNRPDKLNALTKRMWELLGQAFCSLSAREDVRCIILAGADGKAFSPGNDIAEFATERSNAAQARIYGRIMAETLDAIVRCRHPVVAQIDGICVGGGLEIASCCDIRICGTSSRFGAPIKALGLVMAYPEVAALVRLVGRANAAEILLEGDILGADRAKAMGIVNRVVADDQVACEALAAANRIADGAPLVARWHKTFLNRLGDPAPLSQAELDEGFLCFDTQDFQTGYKAFLAKEKPDFEGR